MKKIGLLFFVVILCVVSLYLIKKDSVIVEIEKRIWQQKDYYVELLTDSFTVPIHIKEEWIVGLEEGKEQRFEVDKQENNIFVVILKKQEDYLSIDVVIKRELDIHNGKIITNIVENLDGTSILYHPFLGTPTVKNLKGEEVELVGNIGSGFFNGEKVTVSIGVSASDEKIKNGFSFELDKLHLYEYRKK